PLALLYEYQVFGGSEIGESGDGTPHTATQQTRCNRRSAHAPTRPLLFWGHVGGGSAFLEKRFRLRFVCTENQIYGWITFDFHHKTFEPGGLQPNTCIRQCDPIVRCCLNSNIPATSWGRVLRLQ